MVVNEKLFGLLIGAFIELTGDDTKDHAEFNSVAEEAANYLEFNEAGEIHPRLEKAGRRIASEMISILAEVAKR